VGSGVESTGGGERPVIRLPGWMISVMVFAAIFALGALAIAIGA